jgi:hypothetical protein
MITSHLEDNVLIISIALNDQDTYSLIVIKQLLIFLQMTALKL